MKTEFFTAKTSAENNIQARRSPFALARRRVTFGLVTASIILTACVHEPVVIPAGPGGAISRVDANGACFTDEGMANWVREGVPREWFHGSPNNWYVTNLQYHEGNSIRMKFLNP